DLRLYFDDRADELTELAATVRVLDANQAALELYEIESVDEFTTRKSSIFTERSHDVFLEELTLIADGAVRFSVEQHHTSVTGRDIIIELHFLVPDEYRDTYERVNVAGVDVTERRRAEDATARLLAEKELLLRESHHRVKNNLTMIRSLLSLQARSSVDSDCGAVLEQAAARVQSMITLYEVLFGSDGVHELNLNEYLCTFIHELVGQFSSIIDVRTVLEIEDIVLNARTIAPLGILINEIITNSLKHAFADSANPEIRVTAQRHGSEVTIVCSDNGPGIPENITPEQSASFGLQLIWLLADQIGASMSLSRTDGTRYTVKFPV
ncbi:MAG: sensor histidine kinase, partial [Spirochaetaceae bacterium]